MDGYLFNGIYWLPLSLHNAELQKTHFDNLYKFYCDALNDIRDQIDEKTFKYHQSFIKQLNYNKTRENVIKIFKKDNYEEKVEFNKNKDLFIFEDCVYNLSLGEFVLPNKDDYMTLSCGYKYNEDFDAEEIENAKKILINSFVVVVEKPTTNTL